MNKDFFPPRPEDKPIIYAYKDSAYPNMLKVGYTTRDAETRIAEQYPTKRPDGKKPYTIVLIEDAMRTDGSGFTDHTVHSALITQGISRAEGEWFECTANEVKSVIISLRKNEDISKERAYDFKLRPEQQEAINKTEEYFKQTITDNINSTPRFLWNAKMRFGKTFTTYKLAQKMNWTKVLVLTFKPAVRNAWEEDLLTHVDFQDWQFINKDNVDTVDPSKPLICFGSFQDFLGKNASGGIKPRNKWAHDMEWDCVVLDEYHYGAWRESAKDLFADNDESDKAVLLEEGEALSYYEEQNMPIKTNAYLYLSGTPFRAIATGEFIEEQIYNWTYTDEQKAKSEWKGDNNPYASLPRVVMMTYQLPEEINRIASQGEFDEFDLNEFFAASGEGDNAMFKHEDEVQKWLNIIRGSYQEAIVDNLKLGKQKPTMPFSDTRLLNILFHTLWFLPRVASCFAMRNLLEQKQNSFYHDYKIIVAAGNESGMGVEALIPVQKSMNNPLKSKTITLTCGKLTTGVSVKPWTGIFMLRSTSSPETYFQSAFRVQTPWTIKNPDDHTKIEILKQECYVFDFAPNRALRLVAEYSCRLNINESNPEINVSDFISFLPVLAYDGSSMTQINAAGVLEIATSGTTATLLARRWESALLVNVDNTTLQKIIDNPKALDALMRIEGFRSLGDNVLESIINKSDNIKKLKQKANDEPLSATEKKILSDDEKEYKNLRKTIQEKLIKFATRIPVFMYLTDHREYTLKDVITQLEPALFKKVTGLEVADFELLVSLNVFNSSLMNDAVYKFKRYEDASLEYTGITRHDLNRVGLYDTVLVEDDSK